MSRTEVPWQSNPAYEAPERSEPAIDSPKLTTGKAQILSESEVRQQEADLRTAAELRD
jgi:hypothetical protein